MAIDATSMVLSRSQLQQATDSAALAAAAEMSTGKTDALAAGTLIKDFVAGAMYNVLSGNQAALTNLRNNTKTSILPAVDASGNISYAITVTATYPYAVNAMTHLFGWTTVDISARSGSNAILASLVPNSLSMYLVLDRSGSMTYKSDTVKSQTVACQNYVAGTLNSNPPATTPCYYRKVEAVQMAVGTLMDQLDKNDPTHAYTRTGAIAYNATAFDPSNLAWGTSNARGYVSSIPYYVTGGTDAASSMEAAIAALTSANNGTSEATAQALKGHLTFSRYIVLMTDGEMTGSGSQWVQTRDQAVRDDCASAKSKGVEIYTVAFMAPDKGKSLLQYCASSPANYFEPNGMSDLVAAFAAIGQSATNQSVRLTQ